MDGFLALRRGELTIELVGLIVRAQIVLLGTNMKQSVCLKR
ncbi:MAG TPA: hypothetical protein PKH53_08630 [Candidatus Saccharicenans sp.]|nr:hypothetical protein [Candidatus Saccharicenans sp.]